jgi:hypothetical protein
MGIKAYNRGTKVIRNKIYGDPDVYKVKKEPKKKLDDFGKKIFDKAMKRSIGLFTYFKSKKIDVTENELADMIKAEFRCGGETASKVASIVFEMNRKGKL